MLKFLCYSIARSLILELIYEIELTFILIIEPYVEGSN